MELGLLTVFGAGLLTLATPCVLPMLPVYLTLLVGAGVDQARDDRPRRPLVVSAAVFVAGFSLVFTLLGMAASGVGGLLQTQRSTLLVAGGLVIVLFGLKYLGVLRLGWLDRTVQIQRSGNASSVSQAFAFGVVFALGWTPCVGPILGSVLTYTAATTTSPLVGALYLFTYSLGIGLPLLGVSLAANRLVPQLKRLNRHLPKLERATGLAMVIVGALLIYPALVPAAVATGADGPGPVDAQGATIVPALGTPSERPRLVEFFADHCPVCERMKPRLAQLRDDCVGHRIEVVEVNVADPRNHGLVQRHGVGAVPAIQLFDADGNQTTQLYGERDLGELRGAAATLISSSCAGERASVTPPSAGDGPTCGVEPHRAAPPSVEQPAAVECQSSGAPGGPPR